MFLLCQQGPCSVLPIGGKDGGGRRDFFLFASCSGELYPSKASSAQQQHFLPTAAGGIQFAVVKINEQKPHLKWSQEARRGNSHTPPLDLNCRPNKKNVATYHPAGGRKNFSLPCNSPTNERLPHSANEKPRHFELPVSSNGPFVYNKTAPPSSPFSTIKEHLPRLFLDLAVVHSKPMSWVAILFFFFFFFALFCVLNWFFTSVTFFF